MELKIKDRKEGGWSIRMSEGSFSTVRCILPVNDRFLVVNPFKIESHFADVSSFETALSIVEASGKNGKLKYDQN